MLHDSIALGALDLSSVCLGNAVLIVIQVHRTISHHGRVPIQTLPSGAETYHERCEEML
jgi:hypothetical protein